MHQDLIEILLKQPHAPQGTVADDFKCALYICACVKHYTFEEALSAHNLVLLSFLLASIGYKGDTNKLTIEKYLDTLQELIDAGLIEHIGAGAGFVSSYFKKQKEGKVSVTFVRRQYGSYEPYAFSLASAELQFSDEQFTYPLFSKFMVIPGDDVKVVINTLTQRAYVQEIIKQRTLCMGLVNADGTIQFSEKALTSFDIRVKKDSIAVKDNDFVVAEIIARRSPNVLIVSIREVVNDLGNLNTYIFKAVLEHNIPNVWPENIVRNLNRIPEVVDKEETVGRIDLRGLPLLTIDGEDARDFDDAVYCTVEDKKFRLYVAIADVSYYVKPNTLLDKEAKNRSNSVYFPYFVIPMLPEQLSNGICSLNPNVDRLCMVCEMEISQKGVINKYKFYPAVMNSHARLTYTEAHHMIEQGKALKQDHEPYIEHVLNLHKLYLAMKKAREKRGAFEFESTEVNFLFDKNMCIKGMEPEERNEAHMLIEECMIAANVCAATFVKEHEFQTLYRIHPRSTPEKLTKLRAILSMYGIDLPGGDEPSPLDFKKVAELVEGLRDGVHQVISLQLLRAMSKATYSPDNIGHFGLALENYAHFTSPIRRYPDLQLHRVIKYILEHKSYCSWGKIGAKMYSHEDLVTLGHECSLREREAASAEFDVENSLKCEYLLNFINNTVFGTVSTISPLGVFVTLNDFYIDGMIPVAFLSAIDVENQVFNTGYGKAHKVGEQIIVRIVEVDNFNRKITLSPVLNLRKSDNFFDLDKERKAIAQKAVEDIQVDNTAKIKFFERIADFSLGKTVEKDACVIKEDANFSIDQELAQAKERLEANNSSLQNIKEQSKAKTKVTKASSDKASKSSKATKATRATKASKVLKSSPDTKEDAPKVSISDSNNEQTLADTNVSAVVQSITNEVFAQDDADIFSDFDFAHELSAKKSQDSVASKGKKASKSTKVTKEKKTSKAKTAAKSTKATQDSAKGKANVSKEDLTPKTEVDNLLVDTAVRIDADLSQEKPKQSKKKVKVSKAKANLTDNSESTSAEVKAPKCSKSTKTTKAKTTKAKSNAKAKAILQEQVDPKEEVVINEVSLSNKATSVKTKATSKEAKAIKVVKTTKEAKASKASKAAKVAKVTKSTKATSSKAKSSKEQAQDGASAKTKSTKTKSKKNEE